MFCMEIRKFLCALTRAVLSGLILTTAAARAEVVIPGIDDEAAGINLEVDTRRPAAVGPRVTEAVFMDVTRAGERVVAVGERGIVLLSDDEGANWRQAQVPVQVLLTAVAFANDKLGWAVGHDSVILHTADGGETWQLQNYAPERDAPLLDVTFLDGDRGFAVGALGTVYSTHDGGKTWQLDELLMTMGMLIGTQEGEGEFAPHWFFVGPSPNGDLYLAGEQGVLARSTDAGATWGQLPTPYVGSFFGLTFMRDGAFLAYGMLGNAFLSRDGGGTWQRAQTGVDKSFMGSLQLADGSVALVGLSGTLIAAQETGAFRNLSRADRLDIITALPVGKEELLLFTPRGIRRATVQ